MFNFAKKRKTFVSGFAGNYKSANYRRGAGKERFTKHGLLSIKGFAAKFLVLFAFAASAYLFFFSPVFNVKNIEIKGSKTIEEGALRETVNAIASRKILKIFNNNLLLIKTFEVESAIKDRFKNISAVAAAKKFPKTLVIGIIEKPMDISWCNRIRVEPAADAGKKSGKNPVSAENSIPAEIHQCYLSDEDNIIYQKNDSESIANSVKVFKDETVKIGDKAANDAIKNFIRQLSAIFKQKTGLDIAYLYLPPISSRELHLATNEGWKVYFDLNRGVDEQLEVLNNIFKHKISGCDREKLDYIDLRVADMVFCKAKE